MGMGEVVREGVRVQGAAEAPTDGIMECRSAEVAGVVIARQ